MKPLGHKQIIEHELEGFGIRLNKKPPNIYFKQKEKGGLALSVQCPQSELDKELVAVRFSVLHQQKKRYQTEVNSPKIQERNFNFFFSPF